MPVPNQSPIVPLSKEHNYEMIASKVLRITCQTILPRLLPESAIHMHSLSYVQSTTVNPKRGSAADLYRRSPHKKLQVKQCDKRNQSNISFNYFRF